MKKPKQKLVIYLKKFLEELRPKLTKTIIKRYLMYLI